MIHTKKLELNGALSRRNSIGLKIASKTDSMELSETLSGLC